MATLAPPRAYWRTTALACSAQSTPMASRCWRPAAEATISTISTEAPRSQMTRRAEPVVGALAPFSAGEPWVAEALTQMVTEAPSRTMTPALAKGCSSSTATRTGSSRRVCAGTST